MPIQEIDYDPFAEQYVKEKELQKRRNILEVDYDPFAQDEDSPAAAPPKREALQPPASKVGTLGGVASALGQGLAEGVTTALPGMAGEALEFSGTELLGETVAGIGRNLKEWSEAKGKALYGEPKKREGLERWVYEGSKMLAPSVIPAGAVGAGVRILTGVGKLVKAGKAAQAAGDAVKAAEYFDAATKAAKLSNNVASASTAGLFGTSQAQSTRDTAEKRAAKLEAEGDFEGARQAREAGQGWAPYASGAIEAGGEFFGTKYLGKLFRLDEAGVAKRGAKQLVNDFLKTLGVEVGTEMGQQGGEAAVEKVSGIRPDADPLAEALDVVGPTAFMTLLTGGAAGAVNRMRQPSDSIDLMEEEKDQPDLTEPIRQAIEQEKKAAAKAKPRPSTAKEAAETFFGKEAVENEQAIESLRRRGLYVPEDQPQARSAEESARVFEEGQPAMAGGTPARYSTPIGIQLGEKRQRAPEARLQVPQREVLDRAVPQVPDLINAPDRAESEAAYARAAENDRARAIEESLFGQTEQAVGTLSEIERIDQKANEAATSPLNDRPEPTEPQKQAGNYKKGKLLGSDVNPGLSGLEISIENPRGSERSGKDKTGKPWSVVMQHPYGYFRATQGKDKDAIDVTIGPNPESEKAFIVDQIDPATGKFDEHKTIVGATSEEEARQVYLDNYQEGWQGLGSITEMPLKEFKEWLKSGRKTKPVAYKEVDRAREVSGNQRSDVRKEESGVEKAAPGTGVVLGGEKATVRSEPVLGGENLQFSEKTGGKAGERAGLTEPGGKKITAPTPPAEEIAPPAPAGEAVAPKTKGFDPDNDRQRNILVRELLASEAPEVKALVKQAEETWPGEDPGPVVESQIDYDLLKTPEKWLGTAAAKEILARKGWGEKAKETPPAPTPIPEPERAPEGPRKLTLYRGGKAGNWYTTTEDAAREYANLGEDGKVLKEDVTFKRVAEKADILKAAESVKAKPNQALYWLVSPETSEDAPKVIAELKKQGFDAVHLPEGEDFAPSGKGIESYLKLETTPPPKAEPREGISPHLKSLILMDMRTALEEGHKYGTREEDELVPGQGTNSVDIGTTNPPWLWDGVMLAMKRKYKQSTKKEEVVAVINKEINGKGDTLTPKQLKIWFLIEDQIKEMAKSPHYMKAEEVMSGPIETLIADYNEGAAMGQYQDSDLEFPPTQKEVAQAASEVVGEEYAKGSERLQAYQAERGEAREEENEAPAAKAGPAEEVTTKTEPTKAGTQAVIPGASFAETFDLTGSPGEIGTPAPTGKKQETATIEEVAGEIEKATPPEYAPMIPDATKRRINTLADKKNLKYSDLRDPQKGLMSQVQADPVLSLEYAEKMAEKDWEDTNFKNNFRKIADFIKKAWPVRSYVDLKGRWKSYAIDRTDQDGENIVGMSPSGVYSSRTVYEYDGKGNPTAEDVAQLKAHGFVGSEGGKQWTSPVTHGETGRVLSEIENAEKSTKPKKEKPPKPPSRGEVAKEDAFAKMREQNKKAEAESYRPMAEWLKLSDAKQKEIDARHEELEKKGVSWEDQQKDAALTKLYDERIHFDTAAMYQMRRAFREDIKKNLGDLGIKDGNKLDLTPTPDSILDNIIHFYPTQGAYSATKLGETLDSPQTLKDLTRLIAREELAKTHPSADLDLTLESPISGFTEEGKKALIKKAGERAKKILDGIKKVIEKESAEKPVKQPWEMQKKDFIKDSELSVINNEKEGPKPNKYKEGDLAIDDYGDNPYVYQLQYLDPQKIEFGLEGETRERVINMPSTQKYIEWSKQGIEPSPITVVLQGDKKTPYSTNRRRVIAAQEAGTKKIPAFVEIGRHKDLIQQALSENKPVPENVLAEYPELKATEEGGKGKLEDFGEKVGGARKDTAERGYSMSGKAKKEDEGPAWRKKFVAMEKVHEPGKWVIGSAGAAKAGMITRFGGQVFSSQEEAEKAIPLYAVAQNHSVYQNDDKTYSIYKRVSDRKRLKVVNKDFSSREEAMKHMALHAEDLLNLKTNFGEEILPVPEIAVRKGEERRTKDATPEMFMETFAPRGIEFGNWNNQEERQQVMNHAYDGLLDLADALGLPPKALMLNGELAIAFGARGQGLTGAKAHYETDYGIINLTKMKGAGSLAHEWLHALDHYLGRQDTPERSKRAPNKRGDMVFPASLSGKEYASSGLKVKDSGVRTELKEAFETLLQTMYKRAEQYVEDTKQADKFLGKAREQLANSLSNIRGDLSRDMTAYHKSKGGYSNKPIKFFEPASAEQLAEFDRLASILVEGGSLETKFMSTDPAPGEPAIKRHGKARPGAFNGRYTNDTLEAINAIIKATRNHQGFNKEQTGSLDRVRAAMRTYTDRIKMFKDAEAGTEKTRMRPTSYAIEAKKMDQARTGDYWSDPKEMAARAFAAYVEDKIAEKGGQSDFLVYQAHGGFLLPMIDGFVARPYPEGAEREAINKAFDKFISTIQTRSTPQGVEMYEVRDAIRSNASFAEQLDDFAAGKIVNRREAITVGNTPSVLEMLGAEQVPLVITQGTVEKATSDKHGISIETLKKLPAAIADPIMVFESATEADSLVVMTELRQDGKSIVAAVRLSKNIDKNVVNDIISVHPRNSEYHFINWINQGLLRYQNKQKSRAWSLTSGLQLPGVSGPMRGFRNKILFSHDLVKWVNEKTHLSVLSEFSGSHSAYFQEALDNAARSAEDLADVLQTPAFFDHVNNLLKIKGVSLPALLRKTTDVVNRFASASESGVDSVRENAKALSDILQSHSLTDKPFSSLDAKTKRLMLSHMFRLSKNAEVLRSIVQLIPVDVMNNLDRIKMSPEYLFGNPSMIRAALSGNLGDKITAGIYTPDNFARTVALAGAEASSRLARPDLIRPSQDLSAAETALNRNLSHVDNDTRLPRKVKGSSVRDQHRRGLLKPAKLDDVKRFFPGQEVGNDRDGNIYVKTRGGAYVTIYKVDHIEANPDVLTVGYGTSKLAPGAVIPGAMGVKATGEYYIKLHRVYGDVWTMAHEGLGHFLEVSGVINARDVDVLKAHIRNLHRDGRWDPANRKDIGGPEDRANFIADRLAVKEQRGPIGRIVLRIRAFIDGILETFGIRSPESILRGIESGRVFERTGREGKGRGEQYTYAGRKATGWDKAVGKFSSLYDTAERFEIDDSAAEWSKPLGDIEVTKPFGEVKEYKLSDVLKHDELFEQYPELKNTKFRRQQFFFNLFNMQKGGYDSKSDTIYVSDASPETEALDTVLHEIQHWIQYKENFASGGNESTTPLFDAMPQLKEVYERSLSTLNTERPGWKSVGNREKKQIQEKLDLINRLEEERPKIDGLMSEIEKLKNELERKQADLEDEIKRLEDETKAIEEKKKKAREHVDTLPFGKERDSAWENVHSLSKKRAEAYDRYWNARRKRHSFGESLKESLKSAEKSLNDAQRPFRDLKYDAYRLLAGEIESRDVSTRRTLTAEQRQRTAPFGSEGIRPSEAIVRFDSGGDQYFSVRTPDLPGRLRALSDSIAQPGILSRAWDEFRFQAQDKFHFLNKAQMEAERRTRSELPESQDAYLAETRYHGMAAAAIEDFDEQHVDPLVELMSENDISVEQADEYLHARHAQEANARLREINPDREDNQALSGMSDEEARRILEQVESGPKARAFKEIARKVDAITKARRDLLVEAGLETEDTIAKWEETYQHYVPLMREGKSEAMPRKGRGFEVRGGQKLRAGSTREVVNILANVVAQHEATIVRAEKAKVSRAFLEFAKSHRGPWKIDMPEKTASFDEDGLIVYRANPLGYMLADNVLAVRVAGKDHHVTFDERDLDGMKILSALKNLDAADMGAVTRAVAKISRWLAVINTSLNPEFIISNFARDIQTAAYNMADNEADAIRMKAIRQVGSAFKGIREYQDNNRDTEWARWFNRFRNAGGQTGWIQSYETIQDREKALISKIEDMKHGKIRSVKRGLTAALDYIADINTAVENAIRLSVFKNLVEAGVPESKAAKIAKELTVNFNRKGNMGPVLNAFYLFYNASIQGSARLIVAGAKSRKVRMLMGATVVFAAALDIMNRAVGGDDDDGENRYDKIAPWIKDRNMIIMLPGSGGYLQIPLPWGYNIFHVMGQAAGEVLTKKNNKATASALRVGGAIVSAFNPMGGEASLLQVVSPSILDPFVQWAENKDWSGRKLRPSANPYAEKPSSQTYWHSARTPSKWIAKTLNELTGGDEVRPGKVDVSPEAIDLAIDNVTGGVGKFVSNLISTPIKYAKGEDVETYEIPFLRRVYGKAGKQVLTQEYYENMDAVRLVQRQLSHYKNDPAKVREIAREYKDEVRLIARMQATQKVMKDLRDQLKAAENIKDPAVRKAREKKIDETMQKIMVGFNKNYNAMKNKEK